MVGIFSRFSITSYRRSQSAIEERQVLPPDADIIDPSDSDTSHGIEVAMEFKPVEHPMEPLNTDQPIKYPLPDPSILNDGSIWKAQLSAGLPLMKEGIHVENVGAVAKTRPSPVSRLSLPSSISAPEHSILELLEECKVAID